MTETQMLLLIGTVWVAPHCNVWYSLFVGSIFLLIGAFKGLGWI
jgi:hypothetical protein